MTMWRREQIIAGVMAFNKKGRDPVYKCGVGGGGAGLRQTHGQSIHHKRKEGGV